MEEYSYLLCLETLKSGHSCVLCTILSRDGSAPRGPGTTMVVMNSGEYHGTVGGGALEHAVIEQALACFQKQESKILDYRLHPNEIMDLGMVCGGRVRVCCQLLRATSKQWVSLLSQIKELLRQEKSLWLIEKLSAEGQLLQGELWMDGRLWMDSTREPERISPLCSSIPALQEASNTGELLFVQPICLSSNTYVFGGGHIARELVPLLSHLGFSPIVYDDRPEFSRKETFPTAKRVLTGSFSNFSSAITIKPEDYVVIMTRGHAHDHELLTQALKSPASYIGLIGSRKKISTTKALLMEEGFSAEDFARVHTPIGLPIGAETPAEIAVSIAGEMILHRARKNGSPRVLTNHPHSPK